MNNGTRTIWRTILGMVMVLAGCGCFVLACITAMILASKDT
ncbi:MAG: hypothetical protein RR135_05030 [Oscillospiraceae bacterium]